MRIRICFFLMAVALSSCRDKNDKPIDNPESNVAPAEFKGEVRLFKSEEGWGYDIYVNDEKYVHQPYIPVIQGNHPFKTEADAQKVGELMIQKIQGNIIPPTITLEELQLLEVDIN